MNEIKYDHPNLSKLETELENIAGQWNGDESGSQEDAANAANDALEAIKELKNCLEELDINF